MITFKVNVEPFIEYLNTVKNSFYSMVDTMKKVAMLIELEATPYVPLDTSELEQSYEYEVMPNGEFISMMVGYDAVDPDNDYHYAMIQHENTRFNHPRRGVHHYLVLGIMDSRFEAFEMIETDYLSLFTGAGVGSATTGSREHRMRNFAFVKRL